MKTQNKLTNPEPTTFYDIFVSPGAVCCKHNPHELAAGVENWSLTAPAEVSSLIPGHGPVHPVIHSQPEYQTYVEPLLQYNQGSYLS